MTARDEALRKLAQTVEELGLQSAAREARERRRRRSRGIGALSAGLVLGVAVTLGLVLASPELASFDPAPQERRAVGSEIGLKDLPGRDTSVVTATAGQPQSPPGAGVAEVVAPVVVEPVVVAADIIAADIVVERSGLRARFVQELAANAGEPVVLAQGSPEVAAARVSGGIYGQPLAVAPETPRADARGARGAGDAGDSEATAQPAPWQQNAQSFAAAAPGQAMIAIIVDDLGVDQARSRRAVSLPGPMTMSILPYGRRLDEHAAAARAGGHEVLVHLPMEPYDIAVDAGPDPLLTGLPTGELRARVVRALDAFGGYIGVNNHMGSRFTEDREAMATVMEELGERGLVFVDSVTSGASAAFGSAKANGVPTAQRDVFLDHDPSPEAIDKALAKLERVALEQGYAVGIAHPRDASLDALAAWVPQAIARGFAFVPISAVVRLEMGEEAG